uniref:Uncharacterized protein n=1 Tax=Romanomermis culicivorax TaxID=13658 RepID=A0A915L661_ROMCU
MRGYRYDNEGEMEKLQGSMTSSNSSPDSLQKQQQLKLAEKFDHVSYNLKPLVVQGAPPKRDFQDADPPKNLQELYARYDPSVGVGIAISLGSLFAYLLIRMTASYIWRNIKRQMRRSRLFHHLVKRSQLPPFEMVRKLAAEQNMEIPESILARYREAGYDLEGSVERGIVDDGNIEVELSKKQRKKKFLRKMKTLPGIELMPSYIQVTSQCKRGIKGRILHDSLENIRRQSMLGQSMPKKAKVVIFRESPEIRSLEDITITPSFEHKDFQAAEELIQEESNFQSTSRTTEILT